MISLDGFLKEAADRPQSSKPMCLLTFDDGWRDNYTTALPLLRRYKMPATVFVVSRLIGSERTFWVEQLARQWRNPGARPRLQELVTNPAVKVSGDAAFEEAVEKLKHMPAAQRDRILNSVTPLQADSDANGDGMLSWEETQEMQRQGIEIEAHTATHPLLVYEDDATVRSELREVKEKVKEKLGKEVRAFAYPNGAWDNRVRKMVEESGYACAFSTDCGWYREGDDPFTIRRIMLHEGNVTGPRGRFSPALLSLRLSVWSGRRS